MGASGTPGGSAEGRFGEPGCRMGSTPRRSGHRPPFFLERPPPLTSSYPILSYLTLSYLTLSYLNLPHLILPYLTLPYLTLSYLRASPSPSLSLSPAPPRLHTPATPTLHTSPATPAVGRKVPTSTLPHDHTLRAYPSATAWKLCDDDPPPLSLSSLPLPSPTPATPTLHTSPATPAVGRKVPTSTLPHDHTPRAYPSAMAWKLCDDDPPQVTP